MDGRVRLTRDNLDTISLHLRSNLATGMSLYLLDSHPTARGLLRFLGQLAAVVAIAYAGQVTLEAKGIPDTNFWTTGIAGELHWAIVVCGTLAGTATAFGALYLLHKIRAVQRTKAFNELAQDLTLGFCEGSKLPVDALAAHVWRVRRPFMRDAHLERVGIFKMDPQVASSGIRWVKDKGAVGLGWSRRKGGVVDLEPQQAKLKDGAEAFDALPPDERLHLTHEEFCLVEQYWSVFVVPLFSDRGKLIGIATVGCTRKGMTETMRSAANRSGVRRSTGAIQSLLRGD